MRVPRTALEPSRLPLAVSERLVPLDPPVRLAASLEAALRGVPGLQVDDRHNFALGERLSIRGFGARAAFGVRGVKVFLDDLPATLPDGQTPLSHVDPAAVGSVRVVRGPAAALWGNAAGGVIELRTLAPPYLGSRNELRIDVGGAGSRRLWIGVAAGSGETAFQARASDFRWDGFRRHSGAEVRRAAFSLGREAAGVLRLQTTFVEYDARNPGALTAEQRRADPEQAQAVNEARRTGERGRQLQAGVVWESATGIGEIEAAVHGTVRGIRNPIPFRIVDLSRRAGGARLVLRRTEAGGRVAWAAGGELDAQRDDRRNLENRDGEAGAATLSQIERVVGAGAFVHAALAVSPRLEISAAVRRDRFRYRADDRLVGPGEPDDSGARTLAATSPSVGWTLELGRGWRIYGNAATAFEAPTTAELANRADGAGGLNPALDPQRTRSLEVGARRTDERRWMELAAYRARIEDALIPFELPDAPGRSFYRNAGEAVHRGVEVAAGVGGARASASLAYAWTDARYTRFTTESGDHAGNRVPGIAPHRLDGTLGLAAGPAFAEIAFRASSGIPVDDGNTAETRPYGLADLAIGIEGGGADEAGWSLTVGVTNATDTPYDASVVVNAAGGRFYEPGPPRTFYAILRVRAMSGTGAGGTGRR